MSAKEQTLENVLVPSLEDELAHFVREGERINVRALLVMRNIKQVDIADKYQLARAEVNKVINGKRSTRRIREAIAQELGMAVESLWGPVKTNKTIP